MPKDNYASSEPSTHITDMVSPSGSKQHRPQDTPEAKLLDLFEQLRHQGISHTILAEALNHSGLEFERRQKFGDHHKHITRSAVSGFADRLKEAVKQGTPPSLGVFATVFASRKNAQNAWDSLPKAIEEINKQRTEARRKGAYRSQEIKVNLQSKRLQALHTQFTEDAVKWAEAIQSEHKEYMQRSYTNRKALHSR